MNASSLVVLAVIGILFALALWRVAKKGGPVKGKSGSTPLVDTGQLRDEFDYEITEK